VMELHKVPMTYMPHRYMVPAYAAVAMLVASVCQVAWRHRQETAVAVLLFTLLLGGWQMKENHQAWDRRTHELREANNYLREYDWHGKTITGTWAASLSWQTEAKVFPLWRGFMNEDKVHESSMIVAESDQNDSRGGLDNTGIELSLRTDSVRRFPLWRYQVDLHWLSADTAR
jgi:hypothetical protein